MAIRQVDFRSEAAQDTQSSGKTAIQLENLSAGYGGIDAVQHVTVKIEASKRVALLGPNGAGKSTLFKAIVGLLKLSSGQALINGQPAHEARQAVAYVPQFETVDWDFPVSVIDVVVMGLAREIGWLRLPRRQHVQTALAALDRVGLREYSSRQIGELSGGQKRRVFIARALAQGARILLLDEPFSGVDALAQEGLFGILDNLRVEGVTVLLATHDLNLAATHFDALMVLNQKLIAYGRPEEVFKPDIMAAAFGQQMAIWNDNGKIIALTDQHT